LNGFISEVLCFLGAYDPRPGVGSLITMGGSNGLDAKWIIYVSLLGIVLAAVYILWTIQRVYLGTVKNEEYKRFPDLSPREWFALVPLAFLCIALGVYPKALISFMDGSLSAMTGMVRAALGS